MAFSYNMTINYILNPMVQSVFHPSGSPLIYSVALQHPNKETWNAAENHVENLAKVKVDVNCCSLLIHKSSHFIVQGSQAGQV